jgi:drug/metabolite transporter (DMT)-like permease
VSPTSGQSSARTIGAFILVTLIWGSTWLVIKDQISTVPPSWTVTWRFVVAAIGMFGLALFRGDSLRISRPAMRLAMVVGLFLFCGNFQFVYRAEHYLTSGIVAVLFALLMVPNALLSRIFLRTPIEPRFIAGSVVALAGIGLLLTHEYRMGPPEGAVAIGIALTFAALASASTANVLQATSLAKGQPVVPLIAWAMLWGTVGNVAFSWIVSGPPVLDPRPQYIAGILYLAIAGSVVTFPLYFQLIRDWGAGRAAYNGVAVPVVAMALSTVFEGYRWSALAAGGAMLAITGLLIALSGRK